MTLADARSELRGALERKFSGVAVVDEYVSAPALPAIILEVQDGVDDVDIAGATTMYSLGVRLAVPNTDFDAVDVNRDPSNDDGLAGFLSDVALECSTLISGDVTAGVDQDDPLTNKGAKYRFVDVSCDWYVT